MKTILVILIFCCLGAAVATAQVEGTWEWVSTEYADGRVETPATLGYGVQLYFGTQGEFIRFHDEVVQQLGQWGIVCIYVPPFFIEPLTTDQGDDWFWSLLMDPGPVLQLVDSIVLPGVGGDPPSVTETYALRQAVAVEPANWGTFKAAYR
jgi:hypothetical protein